MAKVMHNDVLDAALNILKNSANKLFVCSALPGTYTEASATYTLADETMTAADYTVADGTVDGRMVTIAQQTGVTVDASGTATYIALCDSTGTPRVLAVTTCTAQAMTVGNTLTVNSFKATIADPT